MEERENAGMMYVCSRVAVLLNWERQHRVRSDAKDQTMPRMRYT